MNKRMAVMGAVVAAAAVPLAAHGSWNKQSGPSVQTQADMYGIEQIEKTWHKAASMKNLNLMMTLFASNATFTFGSKIATGKPAIRRVFAAAGPFQPQNHWISDTPAYKIKITVNGSKGTLYFECHYIDVDTRHVEAVVGGDLNVRKVNGKWLITNATASSPTLSP
jgi:hypothetical protein